jgi:maltose alpha-D-glucosyltransferase/alpha-amylase
MPADPGDGGDAAMDAPVTESLPAAAAAADDPLWYKDAVIYQLHVRAYYDSNHDGIGDFRGLTDKLDYLRDLGVTALWLLPFYPSPLKDDGYDISDYRDVHADYGTRADFSHFLREAQRRGLKVITELVINHTSDQHPWFQAARRAPAGSRKRDFYVWSDDDRKWPGTRIIFTDTEKSNWAWDPEAKAYYWHRFFSHQPDLNFENPTVVKAVLRVMRFWFDLGVDGMRLDAIPYLRERDGTNNENLPETHDLLKVLRAELDRKHRNRMFLAEANQWPEDVALYFGAGDECHMAYHFPLMPRIYMAIAQEDRYPVVEIMQQTPDIPESCQWAIFLRNHDELTLEMVTHKERDYMYQMYAADPRARINLGIRRRLAPLMQNDLDRIRLMNSLLLSMPGSPIIYYGDEIGMGDNIYIGDRNGVRTPMQWSPDRNAGFSRADPQRLYLPPIMDPVYGYEAVNVEAQLRDPSSLLNWMKRMLAVRKSSQAFGRGRITFLRPGNRKVLAYLREHGEEVILCVANLARSAQPVELDLARFRGRIPVELTGRTAFPPIGERFYLLTLPAHGFYWFRLAVDATAPDWHAQVLPPEERPTLVLFDGWSSFFRDRVVPWRIGIAERVRAQLEGEVMPRYLEVQRWYATKGEPIRRAKLSDHALWTVGRHSWLLGLFELEAGETASTYFVPLTLDWESGDEDRLKALAAGAVAKVRQKAEVGVLADALVDEAFCRALVDAVAAGAEVATARGVIRFTRTRAFDELAGADLASLPVSRPQLQSSNSVVNLGDRLFFKAYRRPQPGGSLELEMGRRLTEVAAFPNAIPLAGAIEYAGADGLRMTLGLLQAYVANQGDGWNYTLEYLGRYFDQQRTAAGSPPADAHGAYLALVRVLGGRTGELHATLAQPTGDAAFDPEPLAAGDVAAWKRRVRDEAAATLDSLEKNLQQLGLPAREAALALIAQRQRLAARIDACAPGPGGSLKIRCHGDYHLGQVLLAKNDFRIIDFEGEPGRSAAERGMKHSPLRDVAGMLRSFDYARWTSLRGVTPSPPEDNRLAALAADWHDAARRTFLEAYDEATRGGGLYGDFAAERPLLELFELEKALYELRYEINNRPGWAHVPLQGIHALTDPARAK